MSKQTRAEKMVETVLTLQDKLNTKTAGKYWKSGVASNGRAIDWARCIRMESSELMDCFSWKHWKDVNAKADFDNARVELIDILHFMASLALEKGYEETMLESFEKALLLENSGEITIKDEVRIDLVDEFADGLALININKMFFGYTLDKLLELFNHTGLSLTMAINLYIGKNVLNEFRQNHGYNSGEYIKIWKNGLEDNYYMYEELKRHDLTYEETYSFLEKAYEEVLEYASILKKF